jgi:hypothetical protein
MPFDPDRSRPDKKPGQWRAFRPSSSDEDASWREAFGSQNSHRETFRAREVEVETPEAEVAATDNQEGQSGSETYEPSSTSAQSPDAPFAEATPIDPASPGVLWPETYRMPVAPPDGPPNATANDISETTAAVASATSTADAAIEPPFPFEYERQERPESEQISAHKFSSHWIWPIFVVAAIVGMFAANRGTAYDYDYYYGAFNPRVDVRWGGWIVGVPIVHGSKGDRVVIDYRFIHNNNGALYVWLYPIIPDKGILNGDSFGQKVEGGSDGTIRLTLPKDGFYKLNHAGQFGRAGGHYDVTYRIWWRVEN